MASLIGETVTLTVNYSVFADTLVNVDVYTGTFVVGAGVELSGQAISVTFTSGGFPQTLTGTISANIGANTMSVNFTGTQQAGGLSFILSSVANQSAGNISAVTQTAASGFTPGVNQPLDPSFDNLTNGTVTAGFFPLGFQPGVNLNQTVSFTLNDPVAPTLVNLNGDAANYTQGGPAVNIDTGTLFSLTDPDAPSALSGNQSMSGAVITITDFVAGDLLSFTLTGGITATFVNGVLTLSGLGSRSEYRSVIRSITFSSTSGDPTVGGTDLIRNITTTVTDASGLTSAPSLSTVNIIGLPNTPPVVNFNTGLTLNEAGSAVITAAMLDFNDAQQADTAITYTITSAVTNGTLFNNGVAIGVGGTFTQANLNAGLITYTHNGSETVGALFQFTVSDGAGGSVPGQSFNFTITPVNDAPAFTGDLAVSVAEGGTVAITLADLTENDPDDSGAGLVYSITGAVNGHVELSSNPGVVVTSFTQQNLANGLVVFVHDGSETVTGSFSFSLADGGENGVSPATGTVNVSVTPVNDAPAFTGDLAVSVAEGGTVAITLADLNENDPDDSGAGLVYSITGAVNGHVELSSNPGVAVTSFTQQNLANGLVVFVHDGSETVTGSFSFSLADGGENGVSPATGTVNVNVTPVNDAPAISGDLTGAVNEGGTTAITTADLTVIDPDDSGAGLTYTVTATSNGQVELVGNPNVAILSFTQADLDNGLVVFRHDGSETALGSFQVSLADGGEDSALPAIGTVNIAVNPVNDAPAVSGDLTAAVNEGGTVVITTADLTENDPDDAGTGLVYSITSSTNGQVELSTNPNVAILSFTQADLDNGLVVFRHDGSDTVLGSFSVSLADGGEDGALPATATVNIAVTPADDPSVAIDDTFSTNEATAIGAGLNVFDANPTTADSDPDSTLTVTEVNGFAASVGTQIVLASGALLTLNANGTFSYDPNGAFNTLAGPVSGASNISATDSFAYTTVGGDTATVTIDVAGLDSADSLLGTAGVDSLNAGIDNDELRGFGGADTFQGGTGNDVMFNIDNGVGDSYFGDAGFDTVSYVEDLGPVTINLSNVALNAGAAANDVYNGVEAFVGSNFADSMTGDSNGNVFDGGGGVDTMQGGDGSDTYFADLFNDIVIETNAVLATGGNDLVNFTGSSGTFVLGANIERLTLGGNAAINGTGNGLANTILGNGASNVISGGIQSDILGGGGGGDSISGGDQGDELYGQAGADTLNGDGGNDILSAGDDGDFLYGGANSDQLMGGNGDDFLDGGTGIDVLTGGAGADTYLFSAGYQQDTAQGFTNDVDTLNLDDALWVGMLTVAQVISTYATQTSAGIVTFNFGGGNILTVSSGAGITTAQLLDDITIV